MRITSLKQNNIDYTDISEPSKLEDLVVNKENNINMHEDDFDFEEDR